MISIEIIIKIQDVDLKLSDLNEKKKNPVTTKNHRSKITNKYDQNKITDYMKCNNQKELIKHLLKITNLPLDDPRIQRLIINFM